MAAGEVDHPSVNKGIAYLVAEQGEDGFWAEQHFTATGFPRVFYLRYHGYAKFFPLWALARYRNLKSCQHQLRSGRDVSEALRASGFVIAATGLARRSTHRRSLSAGVRAIAAAAMQTRLDDLIRRLVADGGEAIISFGHRRRSCARMTLTAGTCVVGREVVYGGLLLFRRSGLDRRIEDG